MQQPDSPFEPVFDPLMRLHRAPALLTVQQQIRIRSGFCGEMFDLIQRRVDGSGNVTGGEFRRSAHVNPD